MRTELSPWQWLPPAQRAEIERINPLLPVRTNLTLHRDLQLTTHAEEVGDLDDGRKGVFPWWSGGVRVDQLNGISYLEEPRVVAPAEYGRQLRTNHPDAIPRYRLFLIEHVPVLRGNQRQEILPNQAQRKGRGNRHILDVQMDGPQRNGDLFVDEGLDSFIVQVERQIKCPIWLVVKYPLTT